MKATGIVRSIEYVGRGGMPKEIRRTLRILLEYDFSLPVGEYFKRIPLPYS